jgi:hypothetical protein
MISKPSIEAQAFEDFLRWYKEGRFHAQRLGQAFYNHFQLHKLTRTPALDAIYESNGDKALELIRATFNIH